MNGAGTTLILRHPPDYLQVIGQSFDASQQDYACVVYQCLLEPVQTAIDVINYSPFYRQTESLSKTQIKQSLLLLQNLGEQLEQPVLLNNVRVLVDCLQCAELPNRQMNETRLEYVTLFVGHIQKQPDPLLQSFLLDHLLSLLMDQLITQLVTSSPFLKELIHHMTIDSDTMPMIIAREVAMLINNLQHCQAIKTQALQLISAWMLPLNALIEYYKTMQFDMHGELKKSEALQPTSVM